jgi:hypothetical protein
MASALPLDACPFPRPFVTAFGDCGAYAVIEFLAGRAEGNRLLTCQHLIVGRAGVGRYYAKCLIGGPEERRRFVLARGKAGT